MIEILLTVLASIPIIAIGLLVYFMVFWAGYKSWIDVLAVHLFALAFIWFVWSCYWFSGGKDDYQSKHPQAVELR